MQPWHFNKSNAFYRIFDEHLKGRNQITFQVWDEFSIPSTIMKEDVFLFCQKLPSSELLSGIKNKIIWIPMWDDIHTHSQSWWNKLPKNIKIISFSASVTKKAT